MYSCFAFLIDCFYVLSIQMPLPQLSSELIAMYCCFLSKSQTKPKNKLHVNHFCLSTAGADFQQSSDEKVRSLIALARVGKRTSHYRCRTNMSRCFEKLIFPFFKTSQVICWDICRAVPILKMILAMIWVWLPYLSCLTVSFLIAPIQIYWKKVRARWCLYQYNKLTNNGVLLK